MKQLLFFLSLVLFLGCSNDDDNNSLYNEYASFLEDDTPRVTGKIDGESIYWIAQSIGGYGFSYGYHYPDNDRNSTERILKFAIVGLNDNNYFSIWTPKFNITSGNQFNQVFGLGQKAIGNPESSFYIDMTYNDIDFTSCDAMSSPKLEILKTEEGLYGDDEIIRVWFKFDDMDFSSCNEDSNFNLKEVLVMAYFWGYKFE